MRSKTGAIFGSFSVGGKVLAVSALALALCATADVFAKGGTAKPPKPVTGVVLGNAAQVSQTAPGALGTPGFTAPANGPGNLTGFDVTGLVHNAVVDANVCVPAIAGNDGGTVIINGLTITIPCGTIVQMPANTLTWAEFVNGPTEGLEIDVVGNNVNGKNIGALVYVSQQSLNSGSGVISSIDYANGIIKVLDGNGNTVKLKINDPNGRFSRATDDDSRFSVDDENPTIHSGTGYPMCVPRTLNNPNTTAEDDPECPKINRPKVANGGCRNFLQAGVLVLPASGELAPPVAGDVFCRSFVMPAVSTAVKGAGGVAGLVAPSVARVGLLPPVGSVFVRSATQPDATKQVPLEAGDYIIWSGTAFTGVDYISVHTLEANVGIYTQPGTQPAYVAIGEFGVGASDPNTPLATPAGAVAVAIEATNRMFLEAATTDIITPIDIYYIDYDAAGNEHNRWVTPSSMTGECNVAAAPVGGALPAQCLGADGGITTQYTGPQNQRARIRANKPPTNLLSQPTRYLRVVQRSLCKPTQTFVGPTTTPTAVTPVADPQNVCIANAAIVPNGVATTVANGLKAGQYLAPVGEYIFPENTQAGQPIVPNDLWSLSYLFRGEGPGTQPLNPQPW